MFLSLFCQPAVVYLSSRRVKPASSLCQVKAASYEAQHDAWEFENPGDTERKSDIVLWESGFGDNFGIDGPLFILMSFSHSNIKTLCLYPLLSSRYKLVSGSLDQA